MNHLMTLTTSDVDPLVKWITWRGDPLDWVSGLVGWTAWECKTFEQTERLVKWTIWWDKPRKKGVPFDKLYEMKHLIRWITSRGGLMAVLWTTWLDRQVDEVDHLFKWILVIQPTCWETTLNKVDHGISDEPLNVPLDKLDHLMS